MVSVCFAVFLAVLLAFQLSAATAIFHSFWPPFFGNACQENLCGRGNCSTVSKNGTFGYECICDKGWRQAFTEEDDDLKFLPCVIPNCTLNYTCATTPSPVQNRSVKAKSIFDPCFWTDCGGGTCNQTSPFTFACECEEGYYNLLNSTAFPCYKQCSIGRNCQNIGLNYNTPSSSSGTSPATNLDEQSTSHAATLNTRVDFTWSITMVTSFALVVWKHNWDTEWHSMYISPLRYEIWFVFYFCQLYGFIVQY